jgi:hypothetical protein
VSRRKAFVILLALLIWLIGISSVCAATHFDDISGHWAQTAIEACIKRGVMNGYGSDFCPNASMTRAELATVLDRIKKYDKTLRSDFRDVPPDAWYADSVSRLAEAGVMRGDGGYMRPLASLTREETVVLLARAFNKHIDGSPPYDTYRDFGDISGWAAEAVSCMSWLNYVHGDAQGNFKPDMRITRAEVVTVIDNIMGYSSTPALSEGKIVYASEYYGFRLEFPEEWDGRFKVVDNVGVSVELYNLETSQAGLFAAVIWNLSEYFPEGAAAYFPKGAIIHELGRRFMDGEEYTYYLVGGDAFGVQYDMNDPVQTQSYNAMPARLSEVAKTFEFI